MTEPMDVDEALRMAIEFGWAEVDDVDREGEQSSVGRCEALQVLESLRARLRREREAIEKVRDDVKSGAEMTQRGPEYGVSVSFQKADGTIALEWPAEARPVAVFTLRVTVEPTFMLPYERIAQEAITRALGRMVEAELTKSVKP